MPEQEIDIHGTTTATPAAVWALLDDSSSWPAWTPIESCEIERARGEGVTEIRRFKTGRVRVREEIVERDPERRLTYALLSGLAVREYRAEIDLKPIADGTAIRWHTTFAPKVPATGWIYRRALEKATREFVDGLAARAAEGG